MTALPNLDQLAALPPSRRVVRMTSPPRGPAARDPLPLVLAAAGGGGTFREYPVWGALCQK
jgi:hypothetical protein